ncbi:50S ribosomal protein L24 [bacterium]|nr:50S ribosomal protein L24 [bacterium]
MSGIGRNYIKKGDSVVVISGKEKGKTGRVLHVLPKKQRAVVERVNFVKKHTKPSQKNQKGGIVEKEASLHVSNLLLYCTRCEKGSRIGFKTLENKAKVRYCERCNELIDKS